MWDIYASGVSVTFDREPLLELQSQFAGEFERYGLWLSPTGKPAQLFRAPQPAGGG